MNQQRLVVERLPDVEPLNLKVGSAAPRLNVLVPGMAMRHMSGGPNTALNLTYRMAKAGVPLRYISTNSGLDRDSGPLWNHLQSLTGIRERLPNVEILSAHDRSHQTMVGSNDVFFGTAWWTVQMIKYALPLMHHKTFLYIIQDFEPGLYAWGSYYAQALETYGLDFQGHLLHPNAGRLLPAAAGWTLQRADVHGPLLHLLRAGSRRHQVLF